MKVLHAASEYFPLIKTGGLADVLGALPAAQETLGADCRICLPAYRGLPGQLRDAQVRTSMVIHGLPMTLLEGRLDAQGPTIWLVDAPSLFDRPGDPYHDPGQVPWLDNGWRFGCFGSAVAALGRGAAGWQPDVVHLHDWQTALAAPLLAVERDSQGGGPAIVYTIHNLAYQGQFSRQLFDVLGLSQDFWHTEGLEYWGDVSFMKAGINYADAITTVSPTYAVEIQTPTFGEGLDGVLRARRGLLHGIVNGVDTVHWDPATDPALAVRYRPADVVAGKAANAQALRAELGSPPGAHRLLAYIGRFAHQKGADLLLAAAPSLLRMRLDLVVLGSGDVSLEQAFRALAQRHADRVAVHIGYNEALAHRLTAAADLQLMPSRYEPCGLNQMYAQRYGCVPVVRATGGLADTVTDATPTTLADGSATGVQFRDADPGGVEWGVHRAMELLAQPAQEMQLRRTGMARDFSWTASAREYLALYRSLPASRAGAQEIRI